jgi:hypothetical protein
LRDGAGQAEDAISDAAYRSYPGSVRGYQRRGVGRHDCMSSTPRTAKTPQVRRHHAWPRPERAYPPASPNSTTPIAPPPNSLVISALKIVGSASAARNRHGERVSRGLGDPPVGRRCSASPISAPTKSPGARISANVPYQWNSDLSPGHLDYPATQGGRPGQPDDGPGSHQRQRTRGGHRFGAHRGSLHHGVSEAGSRKGTLIPCPVRAGRGGRPRRR